MKKIYYISVITLQGLSLLSSIINLIVCIVSKSFYLFPMSMYSIIMPYIRFLNTGNIFEIFLLILFWGFSISVYILSTKEILDPQNVKAPFTILNILWLVISYFSISTQLDVNETTILINSLIYGIIGLSLIPLIFLKWSEQNKVMRNKDILDIEDPLPENFQLSPKNYTQISRTAKGLPIIELGVFLFSLYFKYLGINNIFMFSYLYISIAIFALIIFFGTIHDTKRFEKIIGKSPPCDRFLLKLNIMQIVSLTLFAVSFCVFL